MNQVGTAIIGGGQAGLATSYCLTQRRCENIVLEAAPQAAHAWRSERWDSFTLISPNWSFRLPGGEYSGEQPDGFMGKDEIIANFERYIACHRLPVRFSTRVESVEPKANERGYVIHANGDRLEAKNVVIATGLFQFPKIPSYAASLSVKIACLHSSQYRSPGDLPDGAVLVVGSAQSGCQIAEELNQSGRRTFLSIGSAGRVPRRYRGRDIFEWLLISGFFDRTPDKLPTPQAKFAGNPHVTGKNGGHTINLNQFARDGITLVGRIQTGRDHKIWPAQDLKENLAKADRFEAEVIKLIDGYIAQAGIKADPESVPLLRDAYAQPEISEIDLAAEGIGSIIWATGYRFDFSLVKLPVFDGDGFPLQNRGVTAFPGLYFVGLPWLHTQKSGLLVGVGEDADHVASVIASANGHRE